MPSTTFCTPFSSSTGDAVVVPERKPGIELRNATVFSTPPAMATLPTKMTTSATTMMAPWMRSVVQTER